MNYQPFDIVMLRPKFGGKIYAIVAVTADCYEAAKLDRGPLSSRCQLADDEILAKIGTLDPEALKLDPTKEESAPSIDWQHGQYFARHMAQCAATELDRRRWGHLASLQPGAPVLLRRFTRRGQRIEQHRFQEVLPSGQKYHFTAMNANGTIYKWTLESLDLANAQE